MESAPETDEPDPDPSDAPETAKPKRTLYQWVLTPEGCIRITIRNPGASGPTAKQLMEVAGSGGSPRMAAEVPDANRQVWFRCGSGAAGTLRAAESDQCLTEMTGMTVAMRACTGIKAERWDHQLRGKDSQGRDHWVLANAATSHVLEISGSTGVRVADEKAFQYRQLFWYYQA